MGDDRENKLRDGLYVDDERKSVFEKNDDGSTTIYRKFGDGWHEYRTGGSQDAEGDAEADD